MNYEKQLLNGSITIDQLEELVLRSNNDVDEQLRIAVAEEELKEIAVQESLVEQARERHNELKAIELEESEKLEAEIEEKKLLSNASPELTNALNNVKTLEAQLAVQEWENKKLTALVSVLELKIRDLLKRS